MISVHIAKSYPGFSLKADFDGPDSIIGLLGASGCGKSLTLRCIAGIEKPDEGRIVLNGRVLFDAKKRINLPPQERHIGLLFQNYALFPNMTVRKNIETGLLSSRISREKRQIKVDEMLTRFSLAPVADLFPHEISGGEQQRTALARILIGNPELLLLDEPFSALDSYLKWQVELELQELLTDFTGPVILVSHDRDEVYRLTDHICTMDVGRTEKLLPAKELFASPGTKAAALISGCKNVYEAQMRGEGIYLPEFDLTLPVPGMRTEKAADIHYLGLRSHHLRLSETSGIPVRVIRVVEEPFSSVVLVRPCSSPEDAPLIRIDLAKENTAVFSAGCRTGLLIDSDKILLLS